MGDVTKYCIGRIGPVHQGKQMCQTHQDVVPTPRVGVSLLGLGLGLGSNVSVIRWFDVLVFIG